MSRAERRVVLLVLWLTFLGALALLLFELGALLMRPKMLICAAAAGAALLVAGCATADRQAVLQNLQGCERHYNGVVSGGLTGAGFSGAVKIDCPVAQPPEPPL